MVQYFSQIYYLNSARVYIRLIYVYSVISVNDKRLPGHTRKWTLVRSWLIRVRLVHFWADTSPFKYCYTGSYHWPHFVFAKHNFFINYTCVRRQSNFSIIGRPTHVFFCRKRDSYILGAYLPFYIHDVQISDILHTFFLVGKEIPTSYR